MNITLSPDLQKFIDKMVSAGEYSNADAVISEALYKMKSQSLKKDILRNELMQGEDSYYKDDYITLSTQQETQKYFENLKSRHSL